MRYTLILFSALIISACSKSASDTPTPPITPPAPVIPSDESVDKFLGTYYYTIRTNGGSLSPVGYGKCSINTSPLGGVNIVIDSIMRDYNYNSIPLLATVDSNEVDFTIPAQRVRTDTINGNGHFLSSNFIRIDYIYHTTSTHYPYYAILERQ
jgi:hypothetical protein